MPKPVINNRIDYNTLNGRINLFDIWLNQPLKTVDSPTFANLSVTGDCTIDGNFYVYGNASILGTNILEVKDNILLINDGQTTPGVSLNLGGIQISRGGLPDYQIVYNETDKYLQAGFVGNLEPVTLREFTPLESGIMFWNTANKRIESRNRVDIDIYQTSTTNSISSSSGSIYTLGGMGVSKDMTVAGKLYLTGSAVTTNSTIFTNTTTNHLTMTSPQDILLTATRHVTVPYGVPLSFGAIDNTRESFLVTSSGNVTWFNRGHINIQPESGSYISVPNQTLLIFSSTNENIQTDATNNLLINTSQDIQLNPNNGLGGGVKKVLLPANTPLAFNSINQRIIADNNNNLNIFANNNINLTPGTNLNINVPTNNPIKFGSTGLQRIYANGLNQTFIESQSDIFITPTIGSIYLPTNRPVVFGSSGNNIISTTLGTLDINAVNLITSYTPLNLTNTQNSTNASTGALYINNGGLGVKGSIVSEGLVKINSTNSNALVVNNNIETKTYFNVDASTSQGKISIATGDGSFNNPSVEIINQDSMTNAAGLLQLKAKYDMTNNYALGRGTSTFNGGRSLTVNIPNYAAYGNTGDTPKFSIVSNNTELFSVEADTGNVFTLGGFGVYSTQDATNPTTAGFVLFGGLGVAKSIYSGGIYSGTVDNTQALLISSSNSQEFRVDTIEHTTTINQNVHIYTDNTRGLLVTNNSGNSFSINTKNNTLAYTQQTGLTNTTDSIDTSSGSFVTLGGMAVQKMLHVGSTGNFYGSINMNNTKITNLQNPMYSQDAATKAYVDLVKQGLYVKDSVRVATITPLNLATDFVNGSTIDNYVITTGDRILIKDQLNGIENGIYTVNATGTPTRTIDVDVGTNAIGIFVFIERGSVNSNTGWICNSPPYADTIGTDVISFTQFTGAGEIDLDPSTSGLAKNGNNINVVVDNSSIEIISNQVRIKNTAVGTGLTGGSGSVLSTISDQSHVTKVGTLNTGVWNASVINVPYGGTGRNNFSTGYLLIGNGTNAIHMDEFLYFDQVNKFLGFGTNTPETNLHFKTPNDAHIYLEGDVNGTNTAGKPWIKFSSQGRNQNSVIGMSRNYNDFATGVYPNSLVISNASTQGAVQFAIDSFVKFTLHSNGNIGIHTTAPNYALDVNGGAQISGLASYNNNTASTNSSTGAVIYAGGMSVNGGYNSASVTQGGSLTIRGGASVSQDVYIGGTLYCSGISGGVGGGTNTFSKLTLSESEPAENYSSGTLISFGGITAQNADNAESVSNGGSLLTLGGASIGMDMYVGGDLYVSSGNFILGDLTMMSTSMDNTILIKDASPLHISNNTTSNIFSVADTTTEGNVIINETNKLRIGGTLDTIDGYVIYNSASNLYIKPVNNYKTIYLGTTGSLSHVSIAGTGDANITLNSSINNVRLTDMSITLAGSNPTTGTLATTIYTNTDGNHYVFGNKEIVIGQNRPGLTATSGQLVTKLSNRNATSTVTFTPNETGSNLVLSNTVQMTLNGLSQFNNVVQMDGGAMRQKIVNSSVSQRWIYVGRVTDYTEFDIYSGISEDISNTSFGVKCIISIQNTSASLQHVHYGQLAYNSSYKTICTLYRKPSDNSFYLFARVPGHSTSILNVLVNKNNTVLTRDEGTGSIPDGNFSGFDNATWVSVRSTDTISTLKYTLGDLTVDGETLKVNDNLPIIGYNNANTTNTRDLGFLYQRYQTPNDTASGDLMTDSPTFIDSLPSQLTATSTQLILSSLANATDDYYVGWWVKIQSGTSINQVRQIISYVGSQRTAILSTPFTNQNPSMGDTVYLYNNTFVTNYYNNTEQTFILGYTNTPQDTINHTTEANLKMSNLVSMSTVVSLNSTTGSVKVGGSIAISNTADATSASAGGTITSAGGAAISKKLFVGNTLSVGDYPSVQETVSLTKAGSTTMRIEGGTGSYEYIDFVETGKSARYGMMRHNDILSLTVGLNQTPNNANKILNVTSSGNVGISTTHDINSPLTMLNSQFISTNATSGFLGLVGANTNSDNALLASRIKLYANGSTGNTTNAGHLEMYAGTNGNVKIFTNEIEQLRIDSSGRVSLTSTAISSNSSTGSLVTYGGVSINKTQNATSISSGGALTVDGGIAIRKDMYLGGDLYVTGSVIAGGSLTYPIVTTTGNVNCSVTSIYSNNLINVSSYATLTFSFEVIPTVASANCEIQFVLPGRTNGFVKAGEAIVSVSGFTDNTKFIPLFNVLGIGYPNSTNILIKFQSVSTATHYFQVHCNYTLA